MLPSSCRPRFVSCRSGFPLVDALLQSCILAVGTTEKRLVVNESAAHKPEDPLPLVNASYMNFTLSCDHRVVDGAVGAQWLSAFKELIEDPVRMLL